MFSLQLDRATYTSRGSHFISYVSFINNDVINEDILFSKPIPESKIRFELFNIINSFFKNNDLVMEKCIGIFIDGDQVMRSHKSGLRAFIKKVSSVSK
ncbi:hypothetical protein A3Q56_01625 [Intoshia linei]|uniref:Uncharacterized protein n=1 Tax=Intoshia linei TaxID=1819745 RepID=A0A177B8E9_9BILA|nr:hypothetical protein A3Q56_01625 [Intoshia linei]